METQSGLRGIVVDDDDQIREILGRLLPAAGVKVCAQLSSGEEAVEWLNQNDVDLLVMDIQMPGMGGIEATRMIKEAKPATVIFGFTGWGKQDVDAMLQAGATAVFGKTQVPQLLEAIRDSFE